MKIKKGVIAAAGRGTRFLPVVKAYPKELIAILGKPNIQYLVEELIAAGISEIAIVHRHGDSSIKHYFTPDRELEKYLRQTGKTQALQSLKIIWEKVKVFRFIPQPRRLPYGNASPVLAAKSFAGQDPFVFMFGDDLIFEQKPGEYLLELMNIFCKYKPAAVLGAQKVAWSEISKYGSIKYKKDKYYPNRAAAILEKMPKDKAPSNIAQIGRFVVSAKIFPFLESQQVRNRELWFTDAVNTLAKEDLVIAQPIKRGKWLTTGDPPNWLKANIELALGEDDFQKEMRKFLKNV